MKDFSKIVTFSSTDRLLGMLPPFHSLGLVGTVIPPLCTGLRTVYHANPAESLMLAGIIKAGAVTVTIGTPTFLHGILQAGTAEQLKSLQQVFTGAEKCPSHAYSKLKEMLPEVSLCEGYGITECSPRVSINEPDDIRKGTVGKVLPSIEYTIVHPEGGALMAKGQKGILLVRGLSVFAGYLGDANGKGLRVLNNKLW